MSLPTLASALDTVMDTLLQVLVAEQTKDPKVPTDTDVLNDVKLIARGDRLDPRPTTPAIWLFCKAAHPVDGLGNLHETWELPVMLACMVENENDDAGYQAATDLAARARGVILNAKDTVRAAAPYVSSIKSGSFEPSAPWHKYGQLFRAYAEIRVLFTVRG